MIAPLLACAALLATGEPLSEAQAAAEAVRASAAVDALEHRVDEASARAQAAGGLANPELRLQGWRSDRGLDDGRIALRWSPPRPGEGAALRAEADARVAASSADRELARRAVVARARGLHATAVGLAAQLDLAREERAERERVSAAVARRVEAADATVADQAAAELDRLETAAAVDELALRRAAALEDLARLLDLPAGTELTLSPEGGTRCEAPPATPLPVRAERPDPRLEALRAGQRAAEAEASRDRLAVLPWPTYLEGGWARGRSGEPAHWTFQLGVALPIFDLHRAAREADAARWSALYEELRAEARAGEAQLRRALADLGAHAAGAGRCRTGADALDEAVRRQAQHPELAETPIAGQLRARLLAARRAQQRAELQCALDRIEVERLAGQDE